MITEIFTANYEMNYQLVRIALALLGTGIASYFDIFNKKNVPDKLLFGFLALSLIVAVADFGQLMVYSLAITILIGGLGYLMYRTGQMGAADILILMSLCLLLPVQTTLIEKSAPMFKLPFIFSIIVVSGLLFMIYVFAKFTPKIIDAVKKKRHKLSAQQIMYVFFLLAVYVFFVYLGTQAPIFTTNYLALVGILIFASMYFTLFKDIIQDSMTEDMDVKKIGDQEVIAIEKLDPDLVKKNGIPRVFREADRARLIKAGMHKLPVYTGLPMFLPFIFLAVIVVLFTGDIIQFMAGW